MKINCKKVGLIVHLFLCVFINLNGNAQSSSTLPDELIQLYHQTLSLKKDVFQNPTSLDQQVKEHAFYYYVENLQDILIILLTEDRNEYDSRSDNEKIRLESLENLEDTDPYKGYVIAEIKLHWAFVKLKYGDNFAAGWNIRQAFKLLDDQKEKFPDFAPNQKIEASLNILIGSVPTKYNWLLNLFGLRGDINEGLVQLTTLVNDESIFAIESAILSSLTGIFLFENKEYIDLIRTVETKEPENKLVKLTYAMAHMKSYQSELAEDAVDKALFMDKDYLNIPYLHFLKGKILIQKQLYPMARSYFNVFIKNHQGENNIKDAYFHVFLTYWLNNNISQGQYYYSLTKDKGKPISSGDRYANYLLTNNELPDRKIMQMRLATDGGYFEKAKAIEKELIEHVFEIEKNNVEFTYRKARLSHVSGNATAAIPLYEETITKSGIRPWYFAPSSAIQLGHIYEEQGMEEEAINAYQKALDYKDHPYKMSIDQEAKSAIKRIEDSKK